MAGQTSFTEEDARELLSQLQKFRETLNQEWSRVANQWSNIKAVWYDQQFEQFEPIFQKFMYTYDDAERECEKYINFLEEQIRISRQRNQKLRDLRDNF